MATLREFLGMCHQHHGGAVTRLQLEQQSRDAFTIGRIKASRWFIRENEPWLGNESPRQRDTLLLTT